MFGKQSTRPIRIEKSAALVERVFVNRSTEAAALSILFGLVELIFMSFLGQGKGNL